MTHIETPLPVAVTVFLVTQMALMAFDAISMGLFAVSVAVVLLLLWSIGDWRTPPSAPRPSAPAPPPSASPVAPGEGRPAGMGWTGRPLLAALAQSTSAW